METTLKVEGMTCGMCVQHVTKTLQGVPGVQSAQVDLAGGAATVRHDETTDPYALVEAVAEEGYQAHRIWDANK
jgi:copper chaperone